MRSSDSRFAACFLALATCLTAPTAARAKPVTVVVSAETGGDLAVFDPAKPQAVERIKVGPRPRGLKLSPDRKRLLVAVAGPPKTAPRPGAAAPAGAGAGLAIVDVASRKVTKQIATPPAPYGVELSSDGKTAFVSNSETNEILLIDVTAGTITKKTAVGREPQGLALRRDGKALYVATHASDEVSALDPKTGNLLMRIDAGSRPQTVLLAPRGDAGFAIDEGLPLVTMFDAKGNAFKHEIPVAGLPRTTPAPSLQAGVLSPDGKHLYLTTGAGRSVVFVDPAKKTVVGTVEGVGAFPRGIAISPDGKKLYTANGASNDVAIIDVAAKKVEARVTVPGAPWGIVVVP
ncbi:MAG TPA: beta-propeller fold lactonase family protein [Polyangia bacterium]|jgi:YVTN family beta-propeller protein